MDYQKIEKDFKQLEKHTNSLVNQYNKSVDSIKSQELAIQRVKDQIETLQGYKDIGVIKENELQRLNELTEKLPLLDSKLSETKNKANELKNEIKESFNKKHTIKFGSGLNDIGKKIDKFKNKMTRLIGTAMIFSLLRNQLTNLRNGFISLLNTNDTFKNSLNSIKANLMTAFAPIYNACLPAINSLMNALKQLTGLLAKGVASLFGTNIKDATKQAKGLSKALDKTAKSGEDASGSLASIDKLEVMGSSSGSTGQSDSIEYSKVQEVEGTFSSFLSNAANQFNDFISNIDFKKLAQNISKGLRGAIQSIASFIAEIDWKNLGKSIADFLLNIDWMGLALDIIRLFSQGLLTIGDFMLGVTESILNAINDPKFVSNLFQSLIDIGKVLIEGVGYIISGIEILLNNKIERLKLFIKSIGDYFSRLWSGVIQGARDAWNGIKSVFSTVATFFKNTFTNAWNNVKKVFSTGGKIFDGIKDGILNGFKTIVNAIIRGINKVVSVPFNGINTTLRKIKDVNILGAQPFKNVIKTINVPQIPLLAKGAVIPPRQKFAAILGDQKHGTNIEAPLDTIKQANREVLEEFMNQFNGLNNQEREIVLKNLTFVLQMGSTDFRKFIFNELKLYEKDIGKPILVN